MGGICHLNCFSTFPIVNDFGYCSWNIFDKLKHSIKILELMERLGMIMVGTIIEDNIKCHTS